ncbi:hypothetical protein PYW07_013218 [Mythimna separata]|uniref:Pre-C2HC domain-containing protein n=1 Tax=Mythimna separata TaxID=271217 RepID=A0AAD7Y666_MYTSE|nr:hypothetical protein PYW07_013218 [Mythimna separata]
MEAMMEAIVALIKQACREVPELNAKFGNQFRALLSEEPLPLPAGSLQNPTPPAPLAPQATQDPTSSAPADPSGDEADLASMDTSPVSSPSSQSSSLSDSEESQATTETSETSDSDDYEVVGQKRKKGKAPPNASKAKKVVPPPPSPTSPAQADPSPQAKRPASPMAVTPAVTSPKRAPPPPVFIHEKDKWTSVSAALNERKIAFTNARSTQHGIKITVPSPTDYRELSKLLKARNISFHSYSIPEETPERVIIKGIPHQIKSEEVLEDLKSQGVPVQAVHRLHRRQGGEYDMVLAVVDRTEGKNPIFNVKTVLNLSGISLEKPYKSKVVGQCHNCQLFGHSQRNCFATPRCVKCLGDHGTSACPRPKDRNACSEPPSCVNCGQAGHPANYRGCPKAPKTSSPKLVKRASARQQRESPSVALKAPSVQMPERLAPQRQSPWNRLNHQKAFPALPTPSKVAQIPALMDIVVPTPPPKSGPTAQPARPKASPVPAAPAATPSIPTRSAQANFDIVRVAFDIVSSEDTPRMAAEFLACGSDLNRLSAVFLRFPEISNGLNFLRSQRCNP